MAEALVAHVKRFNAGVRGGDFEPMLQYFADDAIMEFEGVPAGPFLGRDAIRTAYASNPPDDEVILLTTTGEGAEVAGQYAWASQPDVLAGEMRLTTAGDLIERLVVSFRTTSPAQGEGAAAS